MTVAAVVAVHAVSVRYPLMYDDWGWISGRPRDVGGYVELFKPPQGSAIYRPTLAAWFGVMREIFGLHALPYHLFALGLMIAAALAVRWLARSLGIGLVGATVAGVVLGAHAALTVTTAWVSAVQSPAMIALVAVAMVLTVRGTRNATIGGAVLLAFAITCRDAAVMTPVMATLLLLAVRWDARPRLLPVLRATVGLWIVTILYVLLRISTGLLNTEGSGAYKMSFGPHVRTNVVALFKYTPVSGLLGPGVGPRC